MAMAFAILSAIWLVSCVYTGAVIAKNAQKTKELEKKLTH